jgi:large subunit ribosomal protein L15
MNLSTLKPAKGATKSQKRIARGEGSGKGGTSTRGHKGAQSRSGYSKKSGFEGGQMPLQRRVPKFGFTSPNRVESKPVNLDVLQSLVDSKGLTEVNASTFIEAGLASKNDIVKILGRGVLTSKVDVTANLFSKSAVEAIEKVGGKVTIS